MKTQMQIVQEAIARLESMSKEEFRASLIKAGAVEVSKFFSTSVSGFETTEVSDFKDTNYKIRARRRGIHREMSIVF